MESINFLLFDTSSSSLKVASNIRGIELCKEILENFKHVENLFPVLESVFKELDAKKNELQFVGVCTGPGSFTGIRIGIASARAIAYSLNIKCFGYSVFDIYKFLLEENADSIVVPIIDGKKNRFFCTFIEKEKQIEMFDYTIDEIKNKLKELNFHNKKIIFTGADFKIIREKIEIEHEYMFEENFKSLDLLNFAKYFLNNNKKLSYPKPIYLRKSEAELLLEKKVL